MPAIMRTTIPFVCLLALTACPAAEAPPPKPTYQAPEVIQKRRIAGHDPEYPPLARKATEIDTATWADVFRQAADLGADRGPDVEGHTAHVDDGDRRRQVRGRNRTD